MREGAGGTRPDPRPPTRWEPSVSLLAAFGGSTALTCALAFEDGTKHLGAALLTFVALVALVSYRARAVAVPAVAGIAWLFYTGFLVDRHGELAWHGGVDAWRLAALGAGAVGGLLAGQLAAARLPRPRVRDRRRRPA